MKIFPIDGPTTFAVYPKAYSTPDLLSTLVQENSDLCSFGSRIPFDPSCEKVMRFALLVVLGNLEIDQQVPRKRSFELNNITTPRDHAVQEFIRSSLKNAWETALSSLREAQSAEFTNLQASGKALTQVSIFAHFAIAPKESRSALLPIEEVENVAIQISDIESQPSDASFSSTDTPPHSRETFFLHSHNEASYYTRSCSFSLKVQSSEPLTVAPEPSSTSIKCSCCSAM